MAVNNGINTADIKISKYQIQNRKIWVRNKAGNIKKIIHNVPNIDKVPPEIHGLENFYGMSLIDREKDLPVSVSVTDDASGVADIAVAVYNYDSGESKSWSGTDSVSIDIGAGDMFYGDFKVTVTAHDVAGNETIDGFDTTEFLLETELTRILSPHDPIFKTGESGILNITAWGYVDKITVKFPSEFQTKTVYDKEFVYDDPSLVEQESIQFMVPLHAPERDDYVITVTAHKDGKMLTSHVHVPVIYGSILDELHTRLKGR